MDMISEDEERWSVMTTSQSSISSDTTEDEGMKVNLSYDSFVLV